MIGQYLPNNNEKRYSAILPKKFGCKPALSCQLQDIHIIRTGLPRIRIARILN
jgi:hypothetical protein